MSQSKITPASLWLAHRAAAGGKSTITGAPLPETINDCASGPQETHYAMACFIATVHGDEGEVPIPPNVKIDKAAVIRSDAEKMGRSVRDLNKVFAPLHEAVHGIFTKTKT